VDRLPHAGPAGAWPKHLEQLIERDDPPTLTAEIPEHLAGPMTEPLAAHRLDIPFKPRAPKRTHRKPRRQLPNRQPCKPVQHDHDLVV